MKFHPIKKSIIITLLITLNLFVMILNQCQTKASLIKTLPGLDKIPCMYSGFVPIDKTGHSQVFYWLIKSPENADHRPLIIWLNGGPGSSSMIGLFNEIGPLRYKNSGLILDEEDSWTSVANVLFVDQPVGTGYSFARHSDSIPKTQKEVSIQFLAFLQEFTKLHPEHSESDIYLMGENYAGKYIPNIAKEYKQQAISHQLKMKLKKIAIGNGLFDAKYQRSARKDLIKGLNILSEFEDESQYDYLMRNCEVALSKKDESKLKHANQQCLETMEFISNIAGDVYKYDVRKSANFEKEVFKGLHEYLNKEDVVSEIHVKEKTIKPTGKYWSGGNETVADRLAFDYNMENSLAELENLLSDGVGVVIYAGQFDLIDGPQGIERALREMSWSKSEEFKKAPRELWKEKAGNDTITLGYIKQYKNLQFITMRNAGHFTSKDRMQSSLKLLQHIFSGEDKISCPDDTCKLWEKKCSAMNHCNNNGKCDETTGGKCECNSDFYGPDCSIKPEKLNSGDKIIISPRDTKLFSLAHLNSSDVLLEIESDDYHAVVSLLNKDDHENVFNFKKHEITYRMENFHIVLYLKKDQLDQYLVSINSLEFSNEIKISVSVNLYSKFNLF
jgi:vitellogenic carboxypeptidase-like protein